MGEYIHETRYVSCICDPAKENIALMHQILGFQTHNINSIFKRCCLIDMIYVRSYVIHYKDIGLLYTKYT